MSSHNFCSKDWVVQIFYILNLKYIIYDIYVLHFRDKWIWYEIIKVKYIVQYYN